MVALWFLGHGFWLTRPSLALAQAGQVESPALDAQALTLPTRSGAFSTFSASHPQPGLRAAARASSVLYPLTLRLASGDPDGTKSAAIQHAPSLELAASYQLAWGLDFGLALGMQLGQTGEGLSAVTGQEARLAAVGARDPRAEIGFSWLRKATSVRPFLAALLPLGSKEALSSEQRARLQGGMTGEVELKHLRAGAEISLLYRKAVEVGSVRWGSQLRMAGALMAETGQLSFGPELVIAPILSRQPGTGTVIVAAEAMFTSSYQFSNWRLSASVGGGLPTSRVGTAERNPSLVRGPSAPLFRFLAGLSFALPEP